MTRVRLVKRTDDVTGLASLKTQYNGNAKFEMFKKLSNLYIFGSSSLCFPLSKWGTSAFGACKIARGCESERQQLAHRSVHLSVFRNVHSNSIISLVFHVTPALAQACMWILWNTRGATSVRTSGCHSNVCSAVPLLCYMSACLF